MAAGIMSLNNYICHDIGIFLDIFHAVCYNAKWVNFMINGGKIRHEETYSYLSGTSHGILCNIGKRRYVHGL